MLLKRIRVLDLSTLLPGPMCSLFLADLGAEVIKVESLQGDFMRQFELVNGRSPYFSALNRNKKSISLNLKTTEGKKIFMKLAKDADVIIEGFRPGKVESLGIGYNSIKRINSKIIYCSITGYGQKGALKNKAGHDLNYLSLGGLLDVMSAKPFVPGLQVADIGCALISSLSIVASLFYREKSGKGGYIDAGIFESALSLISMHIAQRSTSENKRTVLSGSKPCYNIYKTKDGRYISLGAIENKFWQSFCKAINRKKLLPSQFDDSNITMKEMKMLFKSKTLKEWLMLNKRYDFCCEPVKKIEEILGDGNLKKGKVIIGLDGVKQVAMPVIFSSAGKLKYSKAPKLGEHTNAILSSIGYNKKLINRLRIEGVIL